MTTASDAVPDQRTALVAAARARTGAPEQRHADAANAQEFHQIQKFVAAWRRQWPGAMIVLRPDGAPIAANAPSNLKPAPGESPMSDFDYLETPTEADLNACYGSKRRIRRNFVAITWSSSHV
jgi:hypothetical protein